MPIPRKILIRIVGAPLLLAILGGLMFWGHQFGKEGRLNAPLLFLLVVLTQRGFSELAAMCRIKSIVLADSIAELLLTAAYLLTFVFAGREGQTVFHFAGWGFLFLFLYVACKMVFRFGTFHPEGAGLTLFGYAYLGLLAFLLMPPVAGPVAAYWLLFLLAAGKGSDMAAFVAGKSIGKHPMSPVVSPNKTWEGGIAGGIAGTAAGFCVLRFTPLWLELRLLPVAALLLLCLVVTISAQVGDLVKSAFKRWAGVKDSGRLLPEFGGVLDMIDSFLTAAPVAHVGLIVLRKAFHGD